LVFEEWPNVTQLSSLSPYSPAAENQYKNRVLLACQDVRQLLLLGANVDAECACFKPNTSWLPQCYRCPVQESLLTHALCNGRWPLVAILLQHFGTLDPFDASVSFQYYPLLVSFVGQRTRVLRQALDPYLPPVIFSLVTSMLIHPDAQQQLVDYQKRLLDFPIQDRVLLALDDQRDPLFTNCFDLFFTPV
jgi:hypothetical protein